MKRIFLILFTLSIIFFSTNFWAVTLNVVRESIVGRTPVTLTYPLNVNNNTGYNIYFYKNDSTTQKGEIAANSSGDVYFFNNGNDYGWNGNTIMKIGEFGESGNCILWNHTSGWEDHDYDLNIEQLNGWVVTVDRGNTNVAINNGFTISVSSSHTEEDGGTVTISQ